MMLPGAVKYGGMPAFLALGAPGEVLAHVGLEPEQVEDLRDHGAGGLHLLDDLGVRARAGLVLHCGKEHGFHAIDSD